MFVFAGNISFSETGDEARAAIVQDYLADRELATIEASTMETGLDHLNAELLMDKNAAD